MRPFAMALLLGVAGCASSEVRINAGSALPAPPAQVGVDINGGAALRALAIAAALGALFGRERSSTVGQPGQAAYSEGMLEGRAVNAQDCTRPIERPEANLLCR